MPQLRRHGHEAAVEAQYVDKPGMRLAQDGSGLD
jgi:hypothetical protein